MAAAPPLLPPDVRVTSQGLLVRPYTKLFVSKESVSSGVLVLPRRIAPAAFARWTTVASRSGMKSLRPIEPPVVITPAVSSESLMVIGTPWSGPTGSPRATASSARRASALASSARSCTTAFSAGCTASILVRQASTTSTDDTRPSRMADANDRADE